jgi:hypothetical protein
MALWLMGRGIFVRDRETAWSPFVGNAEDLPHRVGTTQVCYERRTPTGDYQPSLRSPWLAANDGYEWT